MLDVAARRLLEPYFDWAVHLIDRPWISPDRLTAVGFLIGLASVASSCLQLWALALILWLISRLSDGLDGPLARRRFAAGQPTSGAGGFLDISSDVAIYGLAVVGIAIGASKEFGTSLWPFLLVLVAYYVNGATLLAFSSIAEKTSRQIDDDRSLSFMPGWAGGTETILVHSLWLALPQFAGQLALFWAAVASINALRQVVVGYRRLS